MTRRRTALLLLAPLLAASAAAEPPLPKKTLEECIALAEANQPKLGASAAAIDSSRERVLQQRSAYLPQVDASWATDRNRTSASSRVGFPGSAASQLFTFNQTGVGLSQVLFDFGQRLNQIRAAQARSRSIEADADTQHETVVFDVKQSYYDVLATARLLVVADDTVRNVNQQLAQAEGRYEVGVAARFDVTRSRVALANAQLLQVTARNNLAVARETLRNAMGLEGPLDFDLVDTLEVRPVPVSEEDAVATAYAQRPELRSIAEQEEARRQDIAALGKQHLPSVTGGANYDYSGSDYPLKSSWNFGATVSVPIFTGGRISAQVGEAKADLRQLEFEARSQRQDIALQVRQAVLDLRRAEESIVVAEEGLVQARENLELADGRYRTGVGSIIELSDAQNALATAEATRVQALTSYQISLASLEKATGRPWSRP